LTSNVNPAELDLKEKVVQINRVAKVVKGGRRFSFNAIIVVGDGNGHVGIGLGKAREVVSAIAKGTEKAKKNIVHVPLVNGTIPHPIESKYGAGVVLLKQFFRFEAVGIQDILTKSLGSANPHNVTKATFHALTSLMEVNNQAQKRGLKVSDIYRG